MISLLWNFMRRLKEKKIMFTRCWLKSHYLFCLSVFFCFFFVDSHYCLLKQLHLIKTELNTKQFSFFVNGSVEGRITVWEPCSVLHNLINPVVILLIAFDFVSYCLILLFYCSLFCGVTLSVVFHYECVLLGC